MTEPTRPDPVPAPPRAEGEGTPMPSATPVTGPNTDDERAAAAGDAFADLDQRPVSEHVAVFEAEHARLQRELGTIDQL